MFGGRSRGQALSVKRGRVARSPECARAGTREALNECAARGAARKRTGRESAFTKIQEHIRNIYGTYQEHIRKYIAQLEAEDCFSAGRQSWEAKLGANGATAGSFEAAEHVSNPLYIR